jgi:hypothetical protein
LGRDALGFAGPVAVRCPMISARSPLRSEIICSDRPIILHPIYYDLDTTLRQLGVAWDPNTTWGRVATAVNHPITLRRALWRSLFRRRSR